MKTRKRGAPNKRSLINCPKMIKRCKNYLIQRIDNANLEYVKGKDCAHDVWKALDSISEERNCQQDIIKKAITTDEV
jgi:hypothetical protein